jgi:hypothetical protein
MGLYLCIFDDVDDEIEGVEIGSYADFNVFRDTVAATVERGERGSVCPVLNGHSGGDGEWTSCDAVHLVAELVTVDKALRQYPPVEFNSEWKMQVAKMVGIAPDNLLDCFFDIDGEQLVDRLRHLAQASISSGKPILFQ